MRRTPRERARARDLFVSGYAYPEVARLTGISLGTLKRWGAAEGWTEHRQQTVDLESASRELALELVAAARESRDPQAVYAARMAAEAAGMGVRAPEHPAPRDVARALLRVLNTHPAFAGLVQRYRADVIELVTQEVSRLEGQNAE